MLQLRVASLAATHAVAAAVPRLARTGRRHRAGGRDGRRQDGVRPGVRCGLGVTEPITSPTFNLVHSYPLGGRTFHHADMYRLGTQHELDDLALGELADDHGIVLVEWGDVVAAALGDHLQIRLDVPDDDRCCRPDDHDHARGRAWAERWVGSVRLQVDP